MQWMALEEERIVFAASADKQKRYRCQECHAWIKLRSGPHRQPHFYHLRRLTSCRQHAKSEEHLGLQLHLANQFPQNEISIERPFKEIGRIADVAWERKKIIFEVQCSPISLTEVKERTCDYRSLGWQLIWILSDKRFNKRRVSAAEHYLREQPCYFASWNKTRTLIYDQWEILRGFLRLHKGEPIALQLTRILSPIKPIHKKMQLPRCLQERLLHWPVHIEGDLLSCIHTSNLTWLHSLLALEKRSAVHSKCKRLSWSHLLKASYQHLVDLFLKSNLHL